MAQPNVAREPSMEEILASIRRIIENNDPVESIDNASYSNAQDRFPETVELTIDEDIALMSAGAAPVQAVAPAARAAESVAAPRMPEKVEQPAARPMSLADVAARVKAASERRAPAAPANDTDRQVQPQLAQAPFAQAASAEAPAAQAQPVQSQPATMQAPEPTFMEEYREPVDTFQVHDNSAASFVAQEPMQYSEVQSPVPAYHVEEAAVDHFEIVNDAAEPTFDEPAEEAALDPIERFAVQIGNEIAASIPAQLLSPVTEEKVSRSFEELADALGGSTRSLDEIAEEMLKPMLQGWLDDNLPTLVERLVREEIERVARGPRR